MTRRPPSFPPAGGPPAGGPPSSSSGESAATALAERPDDPVSHGLVDRLQERRSARRRLRVRAVLIGVAVLLLLAGLVYAAGWSPLLALRGEDVRVEGTTEIVPEPSIRSIVEPYHEVPLVRVDTDAIAASVEALVGVRSVVVERDFPNGLAVLITPRVGIASVEADDGAFALLDVDGVELARSEQPPEGVPAVQVPVGTDQTAPSLAAVLSVLDALPGDVRAEVTQASATTPDMVELVLTDGAQVVWGSAEDSDLKVAALQVLRQVDAEVYDVSAPLAPITR